MRYISGSAKETNKIAKKFASRLCLLRTGDNEKKSATVIGLSGELGAGKTTFVKSFAKAFGVKEIVKSPTFNILKKYEIRISKSETNPKSKILNPKFLYHIDAYRLKNAKELLPLGWSDLKKDPSNIILIEWVENVKKISPKPSFLVKMTHLGEKKRGIDIGLLK